MEIIKSCRKIRRTTVVICGGGGGGGGEEEGVICGNVWICVDRVSRLGGGGGGGGGGWVREREPGSGWEGGKGRSLVGRRRVWEGIIRHLLFYLNAVMVDRFGPGKHDLSMDKAQLVFYNNLTSGEDIKVSQVSSNCYKVRV